MSSNNIIVGLITIISLAQIGIGSWEAHVARMNADTLDGSNAQVYGFTVAKACLNLILGFGGIIIACLMGILGSDNDPNKESKSNGSSTSIFQMGNFGVGIWGLVMYYRNMDIIDPFKEVLLVEMAFFYSILGLIGLMILLSCFACCFACCVADKEQKQQKNTPLYGVSIEKRQPIDGSQNV